MLTAMKKDGERVDASNAKKFCDKGDYYCPRCKKPVYTKKGEVMIDHFSHYPGTFTECETWEPETMTHLLMKDTTRSLFATPSTTIGVEERVGNLWPDLLITLGNGEKIAVECQHSRITESAIKSRTNKLKKHVDHVVWVYSTSNFNQKGDEFFFDEDSKQIEFNNCHPDLVDFWSSSYIVLSKEIRNELGMPLEDSILDCSRDTNRYWRIMDEYERKKWEGMKNELEEVEERMRSDEIDELFGVSRVALEIGEMLEDLKEEWKMQSSKSHEERTLDQYYWPGAFNWSCKKLRKRFGWLYGRLRKRDNLIVTLTETQKKSLNSRIKAARELGFKLSKYKPGLLHKRIPIGTGALFLDFRKISKDCLRPYFYTSKNLSLQFPKDVIQELNSNSLSYGATGLDVEREIRKLTRIKAARGLEFKLSKRKPGLFYKRILIRNEGMITKTGAVFLDFRKISKDRPSPSFYTTRNLSPKSLQIVIQDLNSNSSIYRRIGLDVEWEIRKLTRRIR